MEYTNRNWKPLYIWWALLMILIMVTYYANLHGIFQIVYNSDATHITQVIALILIIFEIRLGWISARWTQKEYYNDFIDLKYGAGREHVWDDSLVASIRKHFHEWWFMSDMLVFFGLIGTLIGFYMNFQVIAEAIKSSPTGLNQQIILGLIPNMIIPIGTVFLPTICALTALVIMKVQLKLFESFSGMDDDQYEEVNDENSEEA